MGPVLAGVCGQILGQLSARLDQQRLMRTDHNKDRAFGIDAETTEHLACHDGTQSGEQIAGKSDLFAGYGQKFT